MVELPEPWLRYIRGAFVNKPVGNVNGIVLTFIESPPYVCVDEFVVDVVVVAPAYHFKADDISILLFLGSACARLSK